MDNAVTHMGYGPQSDIQNDCKLAALEDNCMREKLRLFARKGVVGAYESEGEDAAGDYCSTKYQSEYGGYGRSRGRKLIDLYPVSACEAIATQIISEQNEKRDQAEAQRKKEEERLARIAKQEEQESLAQEQDNARMAAIVDKARSLVSAADAQEIAIHVEAYYKYRWYSRLYDEEVTCWNRAKTKQAVAKCGIFAYSGALAAGMLSNGELPAIHYMPNSSGPRILEKTSARLSITEEQARVFIRDYVIPHQDLIIASMI
jgi:hypothetical protein